MIEFINIILQTIFFLIFTSFPVNNFSTSNKYFFNNYFRSITLNVLILMSLLLIFSFFNIKLKTVFLIIVVLYFIISIINFKSGKYLINKKEIIFYFIFLLIFIFSFTLIAANPLLGWDGIATWKIKSNFFIMMAIFLNFIILEKVNPFLSIPTFRILYLGFFWKNSFIEFEYLGRGFYHYIYILSIFLYIQNFKDWSNFKKLFLVLFIYSATYDFDLEGYQDYLIFSLMVFVIDLIINYKKKDHIFLIIFYSICILLSWIKNEGIIYACFLIIIYNFIYKKNIFINLSFISLFVLSISFQFYINLEIYNGQTLFQIPTNTNVFSEINITLLKNFLLIIWYLFHSILKYPIWIINLILLFICFVYKQNKSNEKNFINYFLALKKLFIFGVFLQSPYIEWHLQTSLDRLVLQTSGFYIYLLLFLVKNKKININMLISVIIPTYNEENYKINFREGF